MIDLPPPDPAIEIVAATRGMSKGLAQTDGPQIVVRPEIAFGPIFFGGYVKNVSNPQDGWEAGALLGARHRIAGIDWTASLARKTLLGMSRTVDDEAMEFALGGRAELGPARFNVTYAHSPNDLGSTGRSHYADAGASVAVRKSARIGGSISRRERTGGPDYTAFNFGITQTLTKQFVADVRYFDTAQSGLGNAYSARIVASLRATF